MAQPRRSPGLINPGNMCYANVGLQTLYQVLYEDEDLPDHHHDDPLDAFDCWTCQLLTTIRTMNGSVGGSMLPIAIYGMIRSLGWPNEFDLRVGRQSDAASFMNLMIQRCNLNCFDRNYVTLNVDTEEIRAEEPSNVFMVTLDIVEEGIKTTQQLYEESLVDEDAHTVERILAAPDFARLYLKRFTTIVSGNIRTDIKLFNRVDVLDELRMTLANGEVVWYDVIGTINHYGDGINNGHYKTYLKSGDRWERMEDATVHVMEDGFDPKDPYMVFYKRRTNRTGEFIQRESAIPNNPATSAPSPNSFNDEDEFIHDPASTAESENDPQTEAMDTSETSEQDDPGHVTPPTTSDPASTSTGPTLVLNTDSLVKATKREVGNLLAVSKSHSARRMWQVIMFIPKRVAGPKTKFRRRFRNLGKNLTDEQTDVVLYTITYERCPVIEKLMRDEYMKKTYDAYMMYLVKGVGAKKISKWLAMVFIGHILHSRYIPARNGVKFEFIFEWSPRCLVTRMLKQEYKTMKEYALKLSRNLTADIPFCVDPCKDTCLIDKIHHHLNLMRMKPYKFKRTTMPTVLSLMQLRWSRKLEEAHSLYPLFRFEKIEPNVAEIEANFKKVVVDLDTRYLGWKNVVVYAFLIVTRDDGRRATADQLYNLSLTGEAKFQTYAGMCRSAEDIEVGYRQGHFEGSGRKNSAVFKVLRRNSTVYKFFSEVYHNDRGPEIEAAWIEILKGITTRSMFLHEFLPEEELNRNRERSAYSGSDDFIHLNATRFVDEKTKMFIFEGDNDPGAPLDMEITGCYRIVQDMEVQLDTTMRKQLPRK